MSWRRSWTEGRMGLRGKRRNDIIAILGMDIKKMLTDCGQTIERNGKNEEKYLY